jgi:glucosamine--fructose-6-phosphate aminotransferase (isomerizing)
MMEEFGNVVCDVEYASEYRYRKTVLEENTALIVISQSGETADTLAALREAKRRGVPTIGVVNVVGSSIARETDVGVYNHIGPEIGVASTKAFISQLCILALLAVYFGRSRGLSHLDGQMILSEIERLPDLAEQILRRAGEVTILSDKYTEFNNFLYLGRKYNYPIALEGALKLKEISYAHAEGYPAGEMKHGPIALVDENFPTIFIAPQDGIYSKNIGNIQEIKAHGGRVLAIATEGDDYLPTLVDDVVYIPKTLEMLTPILAVIPLQLFAYKVAVNRGTDVDQPRNLAKSVTVE